MDDAEYLKNHLRQVTPPTAGYGGSAFRPCACTPASPSGRFYMGRDCCRVCDKLIATNRKSADAER